MTEFKPIPDEELVNALRLVFPGLPDERLNKAVVIGLSTDAMPILHALARERRKVLKLREAGCIAIETAGIALSDLRKAITDTGGP